MSLHTFGFIFCFIALMSCRSNSEYSSKSEISTAHYDAKTDSFYQSGVVLKDIPLPAYPEESFALYLPTKKLPSACFPVILFLDPHRSGEIPVEKYQTLADRYHVILVGSNRCWNELPFEQNLQFAEHLISQVSKCIPIDRTRVALCGFSGGAKTAIIEGMRNNTISTIIYTGAVIPFEFVQSNKHMLGLAGERDMNYTDLVQFDRSLPNTIHHNLVSFKGKHEWPDTSVFSHAFEYLVNGNLKNNVSSKATISDAQVLEEQKEKELYLQAFQTKDLNWWKNAIHSLNEKQHTDPMSERLLGFISLACYSYSGRLLQEKNWVAAEKIITIYQLADPSNPDAIKFKEELAHLKGMR